ncbi:MAG TPA: quercetin 2,3-dioxygenase [Rubrobacteraceae bacterium]|jgi:quercetin dioxygenase-like cupin family protein|nr:quercetin 2,3-dioxygenase [Rubrobacteraceae bacterium]
MEASDRPATHIAPGEGGAVWLLGDLYTFKAVSEDTEGAFALWETTSPPGGGPPPHLHRQEDETFYVLEGEMEFWAGGDTIRAGAGSFVHIPRGTLHTFKNVGTTPARFLGTVMPGGFEKFFLEVGEPATDGSSPPEGPPDVERLVATAAKYNCEIPPPPEG